MKSKHYVRPEFQETQQQELIESFSELESHAEEDAAFWLECRWLENEIRELLHYQVTPGDGTLNAKAKRVLEVGVKHIAEGHPSELFLQFVVYAITRTLNGQEKSLDHAFRLARPPRRPKKDPYQDPAILAALEHIHMKHFGNEASAAKVCAETVRAEAVDKAYTVRWKHTPEKAKKNKINSDSLSKRRKSLEKTLSRLGY